MGSALQSTSCPAPGRALRISHLSKPRGFEAAQWFLGACPPQLQSTFSCSLAIHSLQSVKHNKEGRKGRGKGHGSAQKRTGRLQREKETCTCQLNKGLTSHSYGIWNARSTATQTAPYLESSTSKSASLPCSNSAKHRNKAQKLSVSLAQGSHEAHVPVTHRTGSPAVMCLANHKLSWELSLSLAPQAEKKRTETDALIHMCQSGCEE